MFVALGAADAQDHEREARWERETIAALIDGEAVRLTQANGHRFLGLWLPAKNPRGAVIVAHGRGWGPDYDLYGELRTRLAAAGYSTLSIQLPVLPGTAKVGDYIPTYPDAGERFRLAAQWLRTQHGARRVAIVSHSLGATMANDYLARHPQPLVDAWVFMGILNGLEDMFRIRIPVMDVYAERDWDVIVVGAEERRKQIERVPNSRQLMMRGAQHFYEDRREELTAAIVDFLDRAMK